MTEHRDELDLVTIFTSMGPLQAEVIKSKLKAAGIPALLAYEAAGLAIGILADGLGEVRVQVPRQFEDEAIFLIEPGQDEDELEEGEWEEWDEEES